MRINNELAEKPDHAHYIACLNRLMDINKICHRSFLYTAITCFFLGILTFFTLRFSIISIIPNLFGDGTTVAANLIQLVILLAITGMSALSVGKYKFFNIILFILYIVMTIASLFSGSFADIFTFFIGVGGIMFTFRSYSVWCDYRQLTETEGFPHFSLHVAEEEESNGYVARYEDAYYSNQAQNMDSAENSIEPISFSGNDLIPEMESLDSTFINNIADADNNNIYIPKSQKHCSISESPLKLS